MNDGFHELGKELPPVDYVPSEYESKVHQMLFQTEAGKWIMEKWKEGLIKRSSIKLNQPHDLIDVGIGVGYDNHKRDLIYIVDKINNGGK